MDEPRHFPLVGAQTALESAARRLPAERKKTFIHLLVSPMWALGHLEELGLLLMALPLVGGALMWRIEGKVLLAIAIAVVPYTLWIGAARRLTDWQSGRIELGAEFLRDLEDAQRLCGEGQVATLQERDFRAMRLGEIETVVKATLTEVRARTGN